MVYEYENVGEVTKVLSAVRLYEYLRFARYFRIISAYDRRADSGILRHNANHKVVTDGKLRRFK